MEPTNPNLHDGQNLTAPNNSAQAQEAETETETETETERQLKVLAPAWVWAQTKLTAAQEAQARLNEAQARLNEAQAQLNEADRKWAAIGEQYQEAKEQLEAAQAQLTAARVLVQLEEEAAGTKEQKEAAEAQKNAAQAQLDESEAQNEAQNKVLEPQEMANYRDREQLKTKLDMTVHAWKWQQVETAQAEAREWQQMKLAGWAMEGWLEARQTELVDTTLAAYGSPEIAQQLKAKQAQEQQEQEPQQRKVPSLVGITMKKLTEHCRTQAEEEAEAALGQERPLLKMLGEAEQHAETTREAALKTIDKWVAEPRNQSRQQSPEWLQANAWHQEWAKEAWEEGSILPESKWAQGREWVQRWTTEQKQQAGQTTEERRHAEYVKAMARADGRRLEPDNQSLEH
jgi:hypothetical protein